MGKPGFPIPPPGGRVWAGAARAQGSGATRLPHPLTRWQGWGGRGPRTQAPPAGGFGRAQPSQEQSYVHPVGARRSRVDG